MIKHNNIEFFTGAVGTGKTRKLVERAFTEALKGNQVLMVNNELDRDEFELQIAELMMKKLNLEVDELVNLETCSNLCKTILEKIMFSNSLEESQVKCCSFILIDLYDLDNKELLDLRRKFPDIGMVASLRDYKYKS